MPAPKKPKYGAKSKNVVDKTGSSTNPNKRSPKLAKLDGDIKGWDKKIADFDRSKISESLPDAKLSKNKRQTTNVGKTNKKKRNTTVINKNTTVVKKRKP